ncbi:hypothetical protein HOLleu_15278 [Holothuria leucospilota]|uniref:Uncharacterized protein n=1 Tax=Holothuria leucospilota TaxID=206669 RepID=A0A9Q1C8W1_HOLLE|nr:hypothetical protein HOLleu_15278 [Holothuria leucospilota]
MKVQIETPESRYYTKEDEAVEQSAGKASGLELFPTDNIVVADVSSNTIPDKGVPGKTDDQTVSSTSKEGDIKEQEEIFVKVTSVHDLLRKDCTFLIDCETKSFEESTKEDVLSEDILTEKDFVPEKVRSIIGRKSS